jgi:hypothetical protein
MKNSELVAADIYTGYALTTAEFFFKPILMYIQQFYAEPERGLYIADDEQKSAYQIAGKFAYAPKDIGLKPTIIVSRAQLRGMNIQDMAGRRRKNMQTHQVEYADQVMGATKIRIIAMSVTDNIASEIFDLLEMPRDLVLGTGIYQYSNLVMGEEEQVTGGAMEGLTRVDITVDVIGQRSWNITPTNAYILQGVKQTP